MSTQTENTKGFAEGEYVKVTITGRVMKHTDTGTVDVAYDFHTAAEPIVLSVNLAHDGVDVERLAPPEWPPRRGDVWTDRYGYRYFMLNEVLVSDSGTPYFPEALRQNNGPMTLANRAAKS